MTQEELANGSPQSLEDILKTATLDGQPVDVRIGEAPDLTLAPSEKAALTKIIQQGNLNTIQLGNLAMQRAKMQSLMKEIDENQARIIAETEALQKALADRAEEMLLSRGVDKEDTKNWSFNSDTFVFTKLR